MTRHAELRLCLGGSPAGFHLSRLCTLTLASLLFAGGAAACFGQAQPDAATPPPPVSEKIAGGYMVHQSLEVGGRITSVAGSQPMWDTLVNQGSGGRILDQSLEMHSVNPSKTPFFDSLSTSSIGYGGDPINVTRLKISKGRWYDFSGTFRRDRNYFDYNLFANSLLTTGTVADPVLVSEPDSLHRYNTVRRNTDTILMLLPLSFISFRAGFNHGTHEGPTYSTVHNAGDVQVLNWFRNGTNTYIGGVDLKLARRTTVSYDQFFVDYKGDSSYQLTGANYTLNTTKTPVSLGVDVLGGATTCGSASTVPSLGTPLPLEVSPTGVVNQYCTGTLVQSQTGPIRTQFETEQVRFNSHYWDRASFNGRLLYSGAPSTINSFNETFNGLGRGNVRQTIETGTGPNGQFASNRRVNSSGDGGVVAELTKYLSVSDVYDITNTRMEGYSSYAIQTWTGVAGTAAKGTTPTIPTTSMLTPLTDPTIAVTDPNIVATAFLNQQIGQNTVLATATLAPEINFSAGWRFKVREISNGHNTNMTWHENRLLLGTVMQPSRIVRINLNYDAMDSTYASGTAVLGETTTPLTLQPSNTFTRIAPNRSYRIWARATVKPAKWINFVVAGNDYSGKNDDPEVNHLEHNHDFSFGTSIIPMESLSLDFNYAYDDVYSSTNLCYVFTPTTTTNPPVTLPAGAANSGTCVNSTANPEGSASLYLGTGFYNAPTNFVSGAVNYSPSRLVRINAGARLNDVNGTAEQLNPLMVPGALQSRYVTPFSDVLVNIASQWAWHGNWIYNGYGETGPVGTLAPRNVHGNILTLGVKYAF